MKAARVVGVGLVAIVFACTVLGADDQIRLPEELTAIVQLEGGRIPGTRRLQVSIRIDSVTPREAALQLAGLARNGQGNLLAALKGTSNGRIILGVVEYPLNLVAVKSTGGRRRYVAVTARPFGIYEVDTGQPSLNYPFGVMSFEVDDRGWGEGQVFPAASISVTDDGSIVVQNYSDTPGRIIEVRRK